MPTNAELSAQLAEQTKRATDAEARVEELTKANETAIAERDAARKGFAERGKAIDAVEREKRELVGQLRAYKGSATKARDQVTILQGKLSPEHRPFGAMKPVRTEEERAARAEALDAAFAMGPTQIVFSDGKREIRELAPLLVTGAASWRETPHGRVLNAEIDLAPGDCQRLTMELRGFALLNEAGEQVGWCPRPDVLTVNRNQNYRLTIGEVRF